MLAATINQCGGYGKGPLDIPENCGPLRPSVNADEARNCRFEGQIPNEWVTREYLSLQTLTTDRRDVGFYRPIDKLPGCNPNWPKGTDEKPGCAEPPPVPEMVYPNVYFENLLVSSSALAVGDSWLTE